MTRHLVSIKSTLRLVYRNYAALWRNTINRLKLMETNAFYHK